MDGVVRILEDCEVIIDLNLRLFLCLLDTIQVTLKLRAYPNKHIIFQVFNI